MEQKFKRLRRSELAVPGSNEHMMEKAAASEADEVFLDLEDAVAPMVKDEARGKVIAALKNLDWGKSIRAVRINGLDTEHAYQDIVEIVEQAGDYLDVIMIPKVRFSRDVHFVDTLLNQLELKLKLKKRIGIEILIEEVEGLINVEEIARSCSRVETLILGMGDYSASQGIDQKAIWSLEHYPGDMWHYPRYKMIMAARAAGVDAIDGPFADFKNTQGYEEELKRGRTLGCVGKWAIHPSQVGPANAAYTPDKAAIEKARAMVRVYDEALSKGQGAIVFAGVLIDVATVRAQANLLAQADMLGM